MAGDNDPVFILRVNCPWADTICGLDGVPPLDMLSLACNSYVGIMIQGKYVWCVFVSLCIDCRGQQKGYEEALCIHGTHL